MKRKFFSLIALFIAVSIGLTACSRQKTIEKVIPEVKEVSGAGATFPAVLYQKWFDTYYKEKGIKVNYQAIGSGGGIQQLIEKTVDFGATDAPMTEEEENNAGAPIVHIPTALGAVVIVYNLGGNLKLKFDSSLLADIFLGNITKWNDAKILALNPNMTLPDQPITVIHRSDGSGTTFTFTEYLSKANSTWSDKIGKGKSINWPVGLGGKGNDGVAGLVKQTPGSIGYVELIYAIQNDLSYGIIKNKSGNFIEPTLESVSKAADIALPDDLKISITDTDSPDGYPICTFTWLIAYKEQSYNGRTLETAKAVYNLLWWAIHQGQEYNEPLQYGRLSQTAVEKAEALIKSMTYNGALIVK